jgi:uncharacterized membrane protein YphA (DoxX/SURF4 family)
MEIQKGFFTNVTNPTVINRLFFVRVIVCAGLISGFLTSYPLWINDRFYPLAPVADFIPILPPPFDAVLIAAILILLAVIVFYPKKYIFIGLFILLLYLVLQDQSRLQPWFYQYNFLLASIGWFEFSSNRNKDKSALILCQTILVGTYLWSGLHKLNFVYLFETFEWLTEPAFEIFPFLGSIPPHFLAIMSAVIEAGAGVALVFSSTRQYGTWVLTGMHIFILLMVGPTGHVYNSVVWPWNICFILLLVALFSRNDKEYQKAQILVPQNIYHGLTIVIFLIVPVLNLMNLWDHFPSASLYSGKKPFAQIHVTDTVKEKFPERVIPKFNKPNTISIRDWSYAELNVPEYSEIRIYKHIFRDLCNYQKQKSSLVLEMYQTADLLSGKRAKKIYICHEL